MIGIINDNHKTDSIAIHTDYLVEIKCHSRKIYVFLTLNKKINNFFFIVMTLIIVLIDICVRSLMKIISFSASPTCRHNSITFSLLCLLRFSFQVCH